MQAFFMFYVILLSLLPSKYYYSDYGDSPFMNTRWEILAHIYSMEGNIPKHATA